MSDSVACTRSTLTKRTVSCYSSRRLTLVPEDDKRASVRRLTIEGARRLVTPKRQVVSEEHLFVCAHVTNSASSLFQVLASHVIFCEQPPRFLTLRLRLPL